MGKKNRTSYITECRLCGKSIKHYNERSRGFCGNCKLKIMSEWSKVPFEQRCLFLSLGGSRDETY